MHSQKLDCFEGKSTHLDPGHIEFHQHFFPHRVIWLTQNVTQLLPKWKQNQSKSPMIGKTNLKAFFLPSEEWKWNTELCMAVQNKNGKKNQSKKMLFTTIVGVIGVCYFRGASVRFQFSFNLTWLCFCCCCFCLLKSVVSYL